MTLNATQLGAVSLTFALTACAGGDLPPAPGSQQAGVEEEQEPYPDSSSNTPPLLDVEGVVFEPDKREAEEMDVAPGQAPPSGSPTSG